MRKVKKGAERKKHVFKGKKNAHGKNDTRPIEFTEDYVLKELEDMLAKLRGDKEVAGGYVIYFKTQLFMEREYRSDVFVQAVKGFSQNEKISLLWDRINKILECRAWLGGLKGILSAPLTKFHLINHYGARDIKAVELSGRTSHDVFMREIIRKSEED